MKKYGDQLLKKILLLVLFILWLVLGIGFLLFAFNHPEASAPKYAKWIYSLYLIILLVLFGLVLDVYGH
jgi:hypothetical protein